MSSEKSPRASETFDAEVTVARVLYESPDASFAVIACEDDGGWVHAAGPLAHVREGQRLRLTGRWEEHERYGRQVRAEAAYELDPADAEGARRYLMTIPHIGRSRADRLIATHGVDVIEAIDSDPEAVLGRLKGVGRRQAARAAEGWRQRRALRELYMLLAPHGAGWLAETLGRRHGPAAIEIVRSDPYRLTEEHGIGFERADAIARAHGVAEDSPSRGRAAIVHVLQQAEARGHTHLPLERLGASVRELVGPVDEGVLEALAEEQVIVVSDSRAGMHATWLGEEGLGERLAALAAKAPVLEAPSGPADGVEELADEQRRAAALAFERRLSVVTGGPGTGKTTLVGAIVELARAARIKLELCAPTGRAARRLEEATGHSASTIHRLVEWAPGEGPMRDESTPLACDLLVVDESSMLSLEVARMLFAAVGERTHVVLIGDADQLPPVGAGKPFADLIESGAVPVTTLTHVFRQAARSMIVRAAHSINAGRRPATEPGEGDLHDFFVLERQQDAEAATLIVDLASGRIPEHYGVDPIREVQVLAPIYRGPLGVDELNRRLREALNPDGEELLDGDLRRGDKLIQTRNDYETGLMNGQIAIALGESDDGDRLEIRSDDGRRIWLSAERARTLRLAYAISVHKSQGCEVPIALVAVHRSHSALLSRNLLYTAVTRARRACIVVGQPQAMATAVRRADAFRRHTRLAELVRAG